MFDSISFSYILHYKGVLRWKKEILYSLMTLYFMEKVHTKNVLSILIIKIYALKLRIIGGGQKDLKREINYIQVLRRRNKDYSILPQYYGKAETNLGTGYVFEIIRDYDGNKCKTLEDFITSNKLFSENFNLIVTLLKKLKSELYNNEIITMVLFPENIIFQQTAENIYKVRIINDMGSSVLIPLEYYFTHFARKKIWR